MYYSKADLKKIGFIKVGENTKVSKKSVFHSISPKSCIGDNVRIDDFSSLKGHIELGKSVHISSFCSISGMGAKIVIEDFCGMSTHCSLFTAIEDFVNPTLTSPSIDPKYSKIISGEILLKSASKLGSGCIILPNISIGLGATISANTIVSSDVEDGAIAGPKSRHFKIYGHRNVALIKQMIKNFENTHE